MNNIIILCLTSFIILTLAAILAFAIIKLFKTFTRIHVERKDVESAIMGNSDIFEERKKYILNYGKTKK